MANFEKKDDLFTETMRKLEVTDRAHAEVFNALFQILLNNDNYLNKMCSERGRILIGAASTTLQNNDTLFIIDEDEPSPGAFEGAAYTNIAFCTDAPTDAKNWARIESAQASAEGADGASSIIQGNLTVAEEPASDTVFFAQIEKNK